MTTVTTTRATDLPRRTHRAPARRALTAARSIIATLVVGFVALVALPGTASARILGPYEEGFAPATETGHAAAPAPVPATTPPPESSGWSLTTIVTLVAIAAAVVGLALLVQRAARHRHQSTPTPLAG